MCGLRDPKGSVARTMYMRLWMGAATLVGLTGSAWAQHHHVQPDSEHSDGPHHELGKAQNGVQLDLVGVPPEQVILSVPSDEPGRVEELAAPYLPYLPRLLNAQRSIGGDLLNESLAAWDGKATLDKQRSAEGITARLTSTDDPAYVVLDVHRD